MLLAVAGVVIREVAEQHQPHFQLAATLQQATAELALTLLQLSQTPALVEAVREALKVFLLLAEQAALAS
jgi:hypothetical protein